MGLLDSGFLPLVAIIAVVFAGYLAMGVVGCVLGFKLGKALWVNLQGSAKLADTFLASLDHEDSCLYNRTASDARVSQDKISLCVARGHLRSLYGTKGDKDKDV